jgi:hypothetical protein
MAVEDRQIFLLRVFGPMNEQDRRPVGFQHMRVSEHLKQAALFEELLRPIVVAVDQLLYTWQRSERVDVANITEDPNRVIGPNPLTPRRRNCSVHLLD